MLERRRRFSPRSKAEAIRRSGAKSDLGDAELIADYLQVCGGGLRWLVAPTLALTATSTALI